MDRAFPRWLTILALLTGASVVPTAGSGQVIHGRLLDDSTAAPISGATIVLLSTEGESHGLTFTDSLGIFFLPAKFGTYQLQARRLGYHTTLSLPFQVSVVDTLTVDFFIGPEAIRLAPLIVNALRTPGRELFAERLETGEGVFFTPEMVDSLRPRQHVGEIFRHVEDTWVHWTWGRHENGDTGPIPRVITYVGNGCLHFIVDRTPVPAPFFESSVWGVPPLSEVTPENLVAIEVYRGWHEVPEDFQKHLRVRNRWERDALRRINRKACGVVIIWTTDGW
ncbi:MAG: carboxypeptidase-like regulatory domain-containing protein [Gemmatimonadota bacterium]